jgi:hypothetical protein
MATKVEAIHNLVRALGATGSQYTDDMTIAAAIQDLADAVEDGAISAGGGGSDFLRCDIIVTEGDGGDTVRISNAAKLVSALTYGSGYSPVVVPVYSGYGDPSQVFMLTTAEVTEENASINFGPDSVDIYYMVGRMANGTLMATAKPNYETPITAQIVNDEIVFTVAQSSSNH